MAAQLGTTDSPGDHWHHDIPGARWFRADLQVHTLDDAPGGRVTKLQAAAHGSNEEGIADHARAILDAAVASGTTVLGLTPHAVRVGGEGSPSCLWTALELWRNGATASGRPYRDLLYAVYPGFEVSVHDGKRGVHLAFLFDPGISRDLFFAAHGAAMGNVPPWRDGRLQVSRHAAKDIFTALDAVFNKEDLRPHFLCYTPHAFGENGVFYETASQIREELPWPRISAVDVGRSRLPEEELAAKPWLKKGVKRFRLALIHTTDCYNVHPESAPEEGIGYRSTLIKLAAPTISALRQAFLASEARVACLFERSEDGELAERSDLPDPLAADQPWLRAIRPHRTSFLRRPSQEGSPENIPLSPGLTCIIGGRMTGKSTLLDGLRAVTNSTLPSDATVRADVEARSELFVGGGEPQLQFSGAASKATEWPAQFFTQRELQKAARDQSKIREIAYGLSREEGPELHSRHARLADLDGLLGQTADELGKSHVGLVEARQSLHQAQAASEALKRFEEVGAGKIEAAQGHAAAAKARHSALVDSLDHVGALERALTEAQDHGMRFQDLGLARPEVVSNLEAAEAEIANSVAAIRRAIESSREAWNALRTELGQRVESLRKEVVEELIRRGGSHEDLTEFETYRKNAADLEPARRSVERLESEFANLEGVLGNLVEERNSLTNEQREAIERVASAVRDRFDGQIRLQAIKEGSKEPLDLFIRRHAQRGVTRWWNGVLEAGDAPGASELLAAFVSDDLSSVGMSDDVADSFRHIMTTEEIYRLRAIRTSDTLAVQWHVGEEYRSLERLSGGQQVSVLLSLLLEMDDRNPLIIDQPEDELDNSYLTTTILPRLRHLKGKRQVLFATHNANIVVNGDADQVICLDADAKRGWVAVAGAIEDVEVRGRIIDTLDGGEQAFDLRREKYGF